jgi:DNA-binding NtrC family response regulator
LAVERHARVPDHKIGVSSAVSLALNRISKHAFDLVPLGRCLHGTEGEAVIKGPKKRESEMRIIIPVDYNSNNDYASRRIEKNE